RGDRFTRFRIHEFDPLEGWQFKLVLVQDLKEKYLEMPVAIAVQRAEDRFRLIQEIGNDNQQPPPPKERIGLLEDARNRRAFTRLLPLQCVEDFIQVGKSPARTEVSNQPGVEQGNADLVALLDHQIGQRSRQKKRIIEFRHIVGRQEATVRLAAVA